MIIQIVNEWGRLMKLFISSVLLTAFLGAWVAGQNVTHVCHYETFWDGVGSTFIFIWFVSSVVLAMATVFDHFDKDAKP